MNNFDLFLAQLKSKGHSLECAYGCEFYKYTCSGDPYTNPCPSSVELDRDGNEVQDATHPIDFYGTYKNGRKFCLVITPLNNPYIVQESVAKENSSKLYDVLQECITIENLQLVASEQLDIEDAIDDSYGGSTTGTRKELLNDDSIPTDDIPYIQECIDLIIYFSKKKSINEKELIKHYLDTNGCYYKIESSWSTRDGMYFKIHEDPAYSTIYVLRVQNGNIYNYRNEIVYDGKEGN